MSAEGFVYKAAKARSNQVKEFSTLLQRVDKYRTKKVVVDFEDKNTTSWTEELSELFYQLINGLPTGLIYFKYSAGNNKSSIIRFNPLLNFSKFLTLTSLVEVNLNCKGLSRLQTSRFWRSVQNLTELKTLDIWFSSYLPFSSDLRAELDLLKLWNCSASETFIVFKLCPGLASVPLRDGVTVDEDTFLEALPEMKIILCRDVYIAEDEIGETHVDFYGYFKKIRDKRPKWQ